MNSDYLIIFPVTTVYMDEAKVLLNSLQKTNPDIPVHIMTRNNEAECLKEYSNVEEVIDEPKCDTEFRQVRTSRFRHAVDVTSEGDDGVKAVCILDADMCVIRDITKFFKMAETGTILVGSNNTLLRYVKKDFDAMHVEVDPNIDVVHPTFTTVPTFVNPSIHKDWLMGIWNNKTGNDLDVNNLLAESLGLMEQVHFLSSFLWTNIHHTMLKPELFVRKTNDGLYSNQGEPVYCIHGHWQDEHYVKHLIEPMQKNYGYHKKYIECADNCIRTLKQEYDKYL